MVTDSYRVTCTRAPNWNKSPGNRFSKAAAQKLLIKFNTYCPGQHSMELIKK